MSALTKGTRVQYRLWHLFVLVGLCSLIAGALKIFGLRSGTHLVLNIAVLLAVVLQTRMKAYPAMCVGMLIGTALTSLFAMFDSPVPSLYHMALTTVSWGVLVGAGWAVVMGYRIGFVAITAIIGIEIALTPFWP